MAGEGHGDTRGRPDPEQAHEDTMTPMLPLSGLRCFIVWRLRVEDGSVVHKSW